MLVTQPHQRERKLILESYESNESLQDSTDVPTLPFNSSPKKS